MSAAWFSSYRSLKMPDALLSPSPGSIIGMFILNYDHGSAAAVNQKLRSLNFHSTRDVDPARYIGLIM